MGDVPRCRPRSIAREAFAPIRALFFVDRGFLVLVDVIFLIDVVLVIVIEQVVVFVLVVIIEVELEGRDAGDLEAGAAIVAAQTIVEIDVIWLEIERGIAFRTGGHIRKVLRRHAGRPLYFAGRAPAPDQPAHEAAPRGRNYSNSTAGPISGSDLEMSHYAAARMVLVGDDTAFVRDRFCDVLNGAGHKAIPIATTAELLARVRQESNAISLIVLDLHMPPDGSVDTVRAIRQAEGGRIPILVFSGTIRSADE